MSPGPVERVAFKLPLNESHRCRIDSGVWFLSRYSSLHARYSPEVLSRRVGRSLDLGQFRYYTDAQGTPAAFCNWAWLNAPVLDDVLATGRDLDADEFQCGELPFFYELLAPFGHCRAVVRELRSLPYFRGRRIAAIRGQSRTGGRNGSRVGYFQF